MRNVRLNFRQQERSHLMENMIYNDLIRRGYSVDVGIVELTRIIEGRRRSSQYKIDFVVNVGNDKLYIQSALHVDTPEKKAQETFSLRNTGDFFRKIVVLDGNSKPWTDADGIMYVGVIPFLLEDIVAEAIRWTGDSIFSSRREKRTVRTIGIHHGTRGCRPACRPLLPLFQCKYGLFLSFFYDSRFFSEIQKDGDQRKKGRGAACA